MGVEINDRGMRSTTSGHTAERLASGGWVLSWLPGRVLTRSQAVAGIRLADATSEGLEPGDSRWPSLDSWSRELGLSGPEAVVRVSTSDAVRERIAHGEIQERADELYRRHERCANDVRDAMRGGDQQAVQDAQAQLRRSQYELSSHLTAHRYEVSVADLPWLRYWQNPTYKQQRAELAGRHQIHDQAEVRGASSGAGADAAGSGQDYSTDTIDPTSSDAHTDRRVEDGVIACGDCELDFDDQHDRGEAAYLASVHNELHHAGRPTAVVVPVDVPLGEAVDVGVVAEGHHDAVQRERLTELMVRDESAQASAVPMTGPVETSDAGQAWSERLDAAVFGMDAADPAELDRWMQQHAESSQPHVKEAELVAAWETHGATSTSTSGEAWDGRLAEHERGAAPDAGDVDAADVELTAVDAGTD